jgi:hypothetical protein
MFLTSGWLQARFDPLDDRRIDRRTNFGLSMGFWPVFDEDRKSYDEQSNNQTLSIKP